jgi:ubiquinone/menaquinone biosynthesis C-methylase UbiE
MAAAYDSYDYPSYWLGRDYEHNSEVIALKSYLAKIPKINKIVDIGAGYGRLTPYYFFRANKIVLADPSAKLLKNARKQYSAQKVKFIQVKAENILRRVRARTVDLAIIVRVIHHINDLDKLLLVTNKLLKKNGYLILEFPNKKHLKAIFIELLHGNVIFPFDTSSKNLSTGNKKSNLPFYNYHPDYIQFVLEKNGFEIVEKRSVSNIRSTFLKKVLPLEFLLYLEENIQHLFSYINFGPSIFILARKKS